MTHGEAWVKAKNNPKVSNGYCREISGLPNKMKRQEAAEYYTDKIRMYFVKTYFDKVEDYFGFFEARKMIGNLSEEL